MFEDSNLYVVSLFKAIIIIYLIKVANIHFVDVIHTFSYNTPYYEINLKKFVMTVSLKTLSVKPGGTKSG